MKLGARLISANQPHWTGHGITAALIAFSLGLGALSSGCATTRASTAPLTSTPAPVVAPASEEPIPPPSDASEEVRPREPRTPPPKAFADLREDQILHLTQAASAAEMNLARLAVSRSMDARVKRFAKHVLRDYSEAEALTRTVAEKGKMAVVTCALSARVEDELRDNAQELSTHFGAEFDRRFIAAQVKVHEDVLALIDNAVMPQARSRAVLSMLETVRPALKVRLREARAILKTLDPAQTRPASAVSLNP